uniref:THAP domain-containing protein 4 n=1 Tax=Caligus rogercresseyi TaxID=217165 RepID=C1BNR4_CALRO|nr:THAP domain-containing protein 4 [Caligus rogercresseyi]
MPACSALNCKNRSGTPGISLFQFPMDTLLRNEWIQSMKRDRWMPTIHSRLCSKHFEENLLIETQHAKKPKKLVPGAIPTLFGNKRPRILRTTKNSKKHYYISKQEKNKKDTSPAKISSDHLYTLAPTMKPAEHEKRVDTTPKESNMSSKPQERIILDDGSPAKMLSDHVYTYTAKPSVQETRVDGTPKGSSKPQERIILDDISPLIKYLQNLNNTLQIKIASREEKISELKREVKRKDGKIREVEVKFRCLENSLSSLFNQDQIDCLRLKSTKVSNWSQDTIKSAKEIKFACSTSGYNLLIKKGYPLPSNRTLQRKY